MRIPDIASALILMACSFFSACAAPRSGSDGSAGALPASCFSFIQGGDKPSLTVVDAASGRIDRVIDIQPARGLIPVSSAIGGGKIALSLTDPSGGGKSAVWILDPRSGGRTVIELRGRNPGRIAWSDSWGRYIVTDNSLDAEGRGLLSVIDPAAAEIEADIPIPGGAGHIADAPPDRIALVIGYFSDKPRLATLSGPEAEFRDLGPSPIYTGSDQSWGGMTALGPDRLLICDGERPAVEILDSSDGRIIRGTEIAYPDASIPVQYRQPVWIRAAPALGLAFVGHGIDLPSQGVRGAVSVHRLDDLSLLGWMKDLPPEFSLEGRRLVFHSNGALTVKEIRRSAFTAPGARGPGVLE